MAPAAAASSSSGFSSDEDVADMSQLPTAGSLVSGVHVEVLQEADEAAAARDVVLQCCREAAAPILRAPQPLDLPYEQFTAAVAHVSWHWPRAEAPELAQRLAAYHALRAELYGRFQRVFPLSEDMSVQWVEDAEAGGADADELGQLWERSRGDYWSVPLTLRRLQFLREHGDEEQLEQAVAEAQTTLGAHFARGHEVWALCRELVADGQQDELDKERAIRELFRRQMRLPLDQNDLVMSEFRAWDAYNTLDAEAAGAALEDASKRQSKVFAPLMKKLRGYEERVHAAPGMEDAAAPEQVWLQYLNFVKHRVVPLMKSGKAGGAADEARQLVVCLYERAVSVVCLSPSLWASYLEYLESELHEADEPEGDDACSKLAVARRAVRNVPFDSAAWTELLIEMERQNTPAEEIAQFVRANLLARSNSPMDQFHLLSTLFIWCDSVRRHASIRIRGEPVAVIIQQVESVVVGRASVFSECEQFLSKTFPDFREGKMRLTEYQAKCYWSLMNPEGDTILANDTINKGNVVNKLWKDMLDTPVGNLASSWTAYLEAIRHTGAFTVAAIRGMVFDSAVERVKDSPLVLAEAWLVFERENGNLQSYLRARRYHAKHAHAVTNSQVPVANATSVSTESDKKTRNSKKRKPSSGNEEKNSANTSQEQPAPKRAKSAMSHTGGGNSTAIEVDEVKKAMNVEKKKAHESLTNEHTLFLCNVSKEATQEDVVALFKEIPTLKDVRLVVKTRGDRVKSRGMAYVQFTDEEGVVAGLKRDGALLHGHPLRVERSKPPPTSASTPAAKPASSQGFWKTDPVTLYVGDLNREGSKDQLTEEQLQAALQLAMQSAGQLVVVKRVSILKDRHGKLKNYGLVEVAEPSQAEFCLANVYSLQEKLGEQVTIKPSRFSITHILEQQEKQQKQKQQRKPSATSRGAGASQGANAPHARPSTRLALPLSGSATSLMPRALRRKLAAQSSATKTEPTDAESTTSATTVTPKSNEDFRKMLFNK
ncbi:unnamed protein product [Phytophthora fragariaefolia]|uniref:Unnamed protein product n=1 Tax=Phytophthora fragariaefolia TaxID=1490495 RepID=A0A9W6UB82_9STRA|nr:unnamed protein product [Phytophthora fragariaefolia]